MHFYINTSLLRQLFLVYVYSGGKGFLDIPCVCNVLHCTKNQSLVSKCRFLSVQSSTFNHMLHMHCSVRLRTGHFNKTMFHNCNTYIVQEYQNCKNLVFLFSLINSFTNKPPNFILVFLKHNVVYEQQHVDIVFKKKKKSQWMVQQTTCHLNHAGSIGRQIS